MYYIFEFQKKKPFEAKRLEFKKKIKPSPPFTFTNPNPLTFTAAYHHHHTPQLPHTIAITCHLPDATKTAID